MSKAWQSASRKPQRWTNVRRERYAASTEWSTGKKLGEDVPAEKIEDEQTSIIPTGACGALITALEDEFMGELWGDFDLFIEMFCDVFNFR
ncbi:unnamed protein product [Anisakis simplex]|uniref:Integrator complex subunit 4 (inferred by orthology to a human protein) n=1 Tax=Anisakis simplex TaxID=6269 RepID=A0A0M3JC94_ANISI|nr:unnamed protein product [Anisakis simplex]